MIELGWRLLSESDREREYSPSSCIDDISPLLEAYTIRSAAAREACASAGLPVIEVPYGPADTQTIDLVTPPGSGDLAPLIVFIHGGYWQELSKVESFFAATDCVSHGIAFAAIDYTRAPAASLDEIVAECAEALAVLVSSAERYGIDAHRIVVTGSSAGGQLAAMMGLGIGEWRPAAVCLLSGIFELEPLIGTYVNDAVGLDIEAAHRNSPIRAQLRGFPPTLIAYGENETTQFKRQSAAMAVALRAAGVEVDELEASARNHFDLVFDLCDHNSELGRRLLNLVGETGRHEPLW
jgi:arylformamidase